MTSSTDHAPPRTRADARARLAEIDDAIADIRTQIATADMRRQEGRRVDPDWVHRARTALRHLRRERAEVTAQIAALPDPKATLKDRIIAVVRAEYDEAGWARVMDRARAEAD